MRRFLGVLVVLELAAGGGVLGERAVNRDTTHVSSGVSATTTTTAAFDVAPAAGQTLVRGTLTSLTGDGVSPGALKLPLTIDVENRGATQAVVRQALLAGKRSTIEWDGGRPLPLTGTGGIDLFGSGGAHVTIDGGGATWLLDGGPRALQPGNYTTGFTVGVGTTGLATFHDEPITFQADARTTITGTAGAIVHEPPGVLHLEGPGQLTLTGALRVLSSTGQRTRTSLHFGSGPFVIDLTPVVGGYTIKATLQGPVS
jgi:hypothetical protein